MGGSVAVSSGDVISADGRDDTVGGGGVDGCCRRVGAPQQQDTQGDMHIYSYTLKWMARSSPRYLALFLALAVGMAAAWIGCDTGTEFEDQLGRKVAVYNGWGAWDSSAVAIKRCIEAIDYDVEFLDHNEIQASLDGFGLVIIGGGNPEEIASVLGFTGTERIRSMVERGGGYIGLGAGAYLAGDSLSFRGRGRTEGTIGLFRGYAWGPRSDLALPPQYV
ncbi:hypothetical protein GF324_10885, partial [bacterium]|nr:hypothetical protein [bacterium]